MLTRRIPQEPGFHVVHGGGAWQIAAHVHQEERTGIGGLGVWNRHLSSQEAFVLLRGAGWLCTKTGDTLHVSALSPDTVCVVEAGEWHRLVLLPGACVLIMENADMSRSESMPMPRQDRAAILRALDAPPR